MIMRSLMNLYTLYQIQHKMGYEKIPDNIRINAKTRGGLYGEITSSGAKRLADLFNLNTKTSTFCDIGSGTANFVNAITKYVKHAYALEINPERTEYAKKIHGDNKKITFITGDFPNKNVPKCDVYFAHMCGFTPEDQEKVIDKVPKGSILVANGRIMLQEAIKRKVFRENKVTLPATYAMVATFFYFKK